MDILITASVGWKRMLLVLNLMLAFMPTFFVKDTIAITNGRVVRGEKRFMVYLVKGLTEKQRTNYSDWLCGGAIIHPRFILTSAACVFNVDHIYVISGYKKYVNADDIENDDCTKRVKRRIIYYCVPNHFGSSLDKVMSEDSSWNEADIAVGQVKDPFDFYDKNYTKYCSYLPAPIRVSIAERRYLKRKTFTKALTYGWGHRQFYRPEGVEIDLNEEQLRYSSFGLTNIKHCYDNYLQKRFINQSKRHLFCGHIDVNMDENGIIHERVFINNNRRAPNTTVNPMRRLGGFCQNDHGGPITTFIGGQEVVIGVSTMFIVNKDMECQGPYFYSKARCIGKMIYCFIFSHQYRRSSNCYNLRRSMLERNVTWPDELE